MIETVELTLAHVDLGDLDEVSLLSLFATAQAHRLTQGTGHTLREVTDAADKTLYPAYFWLHLRVPPTKRLARHALWRPVSVGVDVKRFGSMLLDSTYVLGAPDELTDDPSRWDLAALPSMRAASMWMIDRLHGEAQPSAPRAGAIAELPKLDKSPEAARRLAHMRTVGSFGREARTYATKAPIAHTIRLGSDCSPGHNPVFFKYVELMNLAENALLTEHAWPPVPLACLEHGHLLEREVMVLQHSGMGRVVLADVRAELVPCASDLHGDEPALHSSAVLEATGELYEAGSNALVATWRSRKLLAPPRGTSLVGDLARFVKQAG